VEVSRQIILLGYPISLGTTGQLDVSRPLLRQGMVAGKTEDRRRVGSAQSLHPFAPARIDPGVPAIDLFADAPV
jgi:hypothetical protein